MAPTFFNDLRKVFGLLAPRYRKMLPLVSLVIIVAAGLQALAVAALFPFLDALTNPASVGSGRFAWLHAKVPASDQSEFLAFLGAGVLALVVLSNVGLMFSQWVQMRFRFGVSNDLSVRLQERYLDHDYAFFLDRNTSDLNKNVLSEVGQITNSILGPVLAVASNGSMSLALVLLLLIIDPMATGLVLVVTVAGYIVAYGLIRKPLDRLGSAYKEANRRRFRVAAEGFGAIKDVKLLHREAYFLRQFEDHSTTYNRSLAQRNVISSVPKYAIEALAFGGFLAVLVMFLAAGRPIGTIIPIMGTFVYAGYRMMPAFRDMLKSVAGFRFNAEILRDLHADLASPHSTGDPDGSIADPELTGPLPFGRSVELVDLSYTYPNAKRTTLHNIDLEIRRNEAAAFVGPTGAGKTTLIDIILGLLTPTEGHLGVDGEPVAGKDLRRWQRNIGYVPQEINLIDDTVAKNIAFAIPEEDIDHHAVRRAAKIGHIHEFIANDLPDGYDTVVGERGVRLSGGQRQRIGIARALYHDPEVLVLDEATSDIDSETESNITRAINELAGEKTLVIVAHRFSTIRDCDQIFVVDQGRIAARGTFEELLRTSKPFQVMAQEQAPR